MDVSVKQFLNRISVQTQKKVVFCRHVGVTIKCSVPAPCLLRADMIGTGIGCMKCIQIHWQRELREPSGEQFWVEMA